jgi:hypothetical protein
MNNRVLFSNKRKQTTDAGNNMDEPQKHCFEQRNQKSK